jgi:voltage-gated potassium channel
MPGTEGRGGNQLANILRRRTLTGRRAAGIIAGYTVVVTVAGGLLVRLVDHHEFHSVGIGLWWALQTVTTVGYGDIVPSTTGGRLIGAIVMVSGIAFLTVITASVTAALIESARRRLDQREEDDVAARLDEISTRLEAIEAALREPRPPA